MNRYSAIREKMAAGLQSKTGWGRNEILALLDQVLLTVAEEELSLPPRVVTTPTPLSSLPFHTFGDLDHGN